jgi:hypothetical protein
VTPTIARAPAEGVVDGRLETVRGDCHDHQVDRLVEPGEAAEAGLPRSIRRGG